MANNPTHDCGCDRPGHAHSKTKSGTQRYKCPCCMKVWNPTPRKKPMVMGDRPLTNAEKKRRQREKKKRS